MCQRRFEQTSSADRPTARCTRACVGEGRSRGSLSLIASASTGLEHGSPRAKEKKKLRENAQDNTRCSMNNFLVGGKGSARTRPGVQSASRNGKGREKGTGKKQPKKAGERDEAGCSRAERGRGRQTRPGREQFGQIMVCRRSEDRGNKGGAQGSFWTDGGSEAERRERRVSQSEQR